MLWIFGTTLGRALHGIWFSLSRCFSALVLFIFYFFSLFTFTTVQREPGCRCVGAHGWVAGIASHRSVLLSRGWPITVEAPGHPGHPPSTNLNAAVRLSYALFTPKLRYIFKLLNIIILKLFSLTRFYIVFLSNHMHCFYFFFYFKFSTLRSTNVTKPCLNHVPKRCFSIFLWQISIS